MPRTPAHCRYFANGICSRGNSCTFVHDEAKRNDGVCQFNVAGKCSFGQSCRFLHVRPRNDERPSSSSQQQPPITRLQFQSIPTTSRVRPVQLAEPGLNVRAPEFVPSWKKEVPRSSAPTSYASAASSSLPDPPAPPSEDVPFVMTYRHTRMDLCPYWLRNGECSRKDGDCPFAHGDHCDMCNQWTLHPYNEERRRQHQTDCLETHTREMERAFIMQRTETKTCGICMENISEKGLRFGILNNCQHCFCLDCIRQWRTRHEASSDLGSKTTRSCPECRQHSDYVIPSIVWVETGDEKNLLISMYKENVGQKVCKYYSNNATRGNCKFGNKCFYKHQLPDGSIDPGESPHVRRRAQLSDFIFESENDEEETSLYDQMIRELDDMQSSEDRLLVQQMAELIRSMQIGTAAFEQVSSTESDTSTDHTFDFVSDEISD